MKIVNVTDDVSLVRSIERGTEQQHQAVIDIIYDVRKNGDEALYRLTEKFDHVRMESLKVTQEEIDAAYNEISQEELEVIQEAARNIREFHKQQARKSWFMTKEDGTLLGQKITPLDSVGVYVPGGTAAYPSSVLMNVIPAQVAGVSRIVMASPVQKSGTLPSGVLVAAHESGVTEMYKVGGAQAIAALAYGSETIPPVDKITGPGNIFVALAKREVFGVVDIDMIAGPSEIVVLADDSAKAPYVAADLLSQAEHDVRASAVLVTPSTQLAQAVADEVEKQLATLPRKDIAEASIRDYGAIYVTKDMKEALDVVNQLAPEHLEVATKTPFDILPQIRHAGAIFLGHYSSEPVGDYFAGPNHVLPTNGTARFSSPLNVDDFVKKSSIISYSKTAIVDNAKKIARFARLEGLEAHARAVLMRLEEKE